MEAKDILKELMESDELQTYFGISREEARKASLTDDTGCVPIEIIKAIIGHVEANHSLSTTYQGILKRLAK